MFAPFEARCITTSATYGQTWFALAWRVQCSTALHPSNHRKTYSSAVPISMQALGHTDENFVSILLLFSYIIFVFLAMHLEWNGAFRETRYHRTNNEPCLLLLCALSSKPWLWTRGHEMKSFAKHPANAAIWWRSTCVHASSAPLGDVCWLIRND